MPQAHMFQVQGCLDEISFTKPATALLTTSDRRTMPVVYAKAAAGDPAGSDLEVVQTTQLWVREGLRGSTHTQVSDFGTLDLNLLRHNTCTEIKPGLGESPVPTFKRPKDGGDCWSAHGGMDMGARAQAVKGGRTRATHQ